MSSQHVEFVNQYTDSRYLKNPDAPSYEEAMRDRQYETDRCNFHSDCWETPVEGSTWCAGHLAAMAGVEQ